MAAPTYLPELDTNGTNQPADVAGIPQANKDDGFLGNQTVPNTFWNWLGKTIHDWIVYLRDNAGVFGAVGPSSEIANTTSLITFDVEVPVPGSGADPIPEGAVLEVEAFFQVLDYNSGDLVIQILRRSTVVASVSTSAESITIAPGDWWRVTYKSRIGEGGTAAARPHASIIETQWEGEVVKYVGPGSTTLNTELDKDFSANAQWTVAHADNRVIMHHLYVRLNDA